jgi:hypothetical protein
VQIGGDGRGRCLLKLSQYLFDSHEFSSLVRGLGQTPCRVFSGPQMAVAVV